jgi:hypothetical protein
MLRRTPRALMLAGGLVVAIASAASASVSHRVSLTVKDDTLTGCLQKGDQSGTFKLAAKDGKTYTVMGQQSALSPHVGHTVKLTGNQGSASSGAIARDTGMGKMADSSMKGGMHDSSSMGKSGGNANGFMATQVQMVAATCQ